MPLLAAVALGIVHPFVAVFLMGKLIVNDPIMDWLLDVFARQGHEFASGVAIHIHDLLVYLVIAIPFAFLVAGLKPRLNWRYLWVALGVSVFIINLDILIPLPTLEYVLRFWPYWLLQSLVMAAAFIIAYAAVIAFRRSENAA